MLKPVSLEAARSAFAVLVDQLDAQYNEWKATQTKNDHMKKGA
jgi:hypothetical protein